MKKNIVSILICLFVLTLAFGMSSCNKDAHCPAYKSLKKDNMDTKKKGKTSLFPKGM